MAPIKPKSVKGKAKPSPSSNSKAANLSTSNLSKVTKSSKNFRQGATAAKQSQVKTKRLSAKDQIKNKQKKKRVYTAEELKVPTLNGIVPVGVEKPKSGKKKGKVFVDDADSMLTILKIVEADKQGQIESKIARERQLEEVREARRIEGEKKFEEKKRKLEDVKDGLRKKHKKRQEREEAEMNAEADAGAGAGGGKKERKPRKKVSFG